MRGIQQTRISMTFDGAPLNDPAEHALFFNNFHDFLSAIDSIQIQRGVGTSSVGSPAFGGSVNFASSPPAQDHRGEARLVLGSYDTTRASIGYESGLFDNGLYVSGRFSYANTDGYRERSGTEHNTLFLNAGWQGERIVVDAGCILGRREVAARLSRRRSGHPKREPAFQPAHRGGPRQLRPRLRTQLKYMRDLGGETLLTASFYYNGADGWFQLWDDPVAQNDLLRFGIDQGFFGSMVTLSTSVDNLSATVGCALQRLQRRPFPRQRRRRSGLQEHWLQGDGERLRQAGVPARTNDPVRRPPLALGRFLVRRRYRFGLGRLELSRSQDRRAANARSGVESLRVDRQGTARAGAPRSSAGRGQRHRSA